MSNEEETNVRIVGVSIPFFDKVWLMVGFALASIPAMVILIYVSRSRSLGASKVIVFKSYPF